MQIIRRISFANILKILQQDTRHKFYNQPPHLHSKNAHGLTGTNYTKQDAYKSHDGTHTKENYATQSIAEHSAGGLLLPHLILQDLSCMRAHLLNGAKSFS
jgi:hypothetical protein